MNALYSLAKVTILGIILTTSLVADGQIPNARTCKLTPSDLTNPNTATDKHFELLSRPGMSEKSLNDYVNITEEIKRCRPFDSMTDLDDFLNHSPNRKRPDVSSSCAHSNIRPLNGDQLKELHGKLFIPIDINKFAKTNSYSGDYREMLKDLFLIGIGEKEARALILNNQSQSLVLPYRTREMFFLRLVELQGCDWANKIVRYFIVQ